MISLKSRIEVFKRRRRLNETIPKVFIDELIDSFESKMEEFQKASIEAIEDIKGGHPNWAIETLQKSLKGVSNE